ncbi:MULTISPECIES: class I SAM-dependent methyltransferase [Nocardiopsis]|uniref:C-methyltransferase n=2 Tax=Nocardiopsis dassonvillei TaxID=2014 RepID=D7B010_NOCDD|nr:class I SAM-dependent methyltransferase [Nocardiopsis dassonvillei]ADH70098.1 C-methyltransferase [Nocardiopsis dassonvillei subsp. dassonvillei DSM 43111]NKY80611.1 class I SAM-dependent methyltransferase [Nocardiopsis dassonvillei]VEI90613.1 Predicted methyltransferase (contains TPR repeat) [Nocardiopsis dassonvillei]
MVPTTTCRVCEGTVTQFMDFGRQPLSDAFRAPDDTSEEFFYRLAVGLCPDCQMVQLMEEVPRERMFHEGYPYYSSGSTVMRSHFEATAEKLLAEHLTGSDPFVVELGCNDGVMLETVARAGVRHLGMEPSGAVAEVARGKGVRVRNAFFEKATALEILAEDGPADVVYAANTFCHIPYVDSVLEGIGELLSPGGVFVFEDPYFGDVSEKASFDQFYDEHFFLFTASSVRNMARRFGLELVDVERLPTHGGELRYTLAREGSRAASPAVEAILEEERKRELTSPESLASFADRVRGNCDRLVEELRSLRDQGLRVVGYGATAKSATVLNFCGIGPDLLEFVCDTTPAKQGRLTPGSHVPVRDHGAFTASYPDRALLLAWNHAEEIMAKEEGFREAGGRWIHYVPDVTTV